METTQTTTAGPDLFWSETGEIDCAAHAPMRGSDTWTSGRWKKMSPRDLAGYIAAGITPVCECCAAKAARK